MDQPYISYPHTETSFEVGQSLRSSLLRPFDAIIERLRAAFAGDAPDLHIEDVYGQMLDEGPHRSWYSIHNMYQYYEERYPRLLSGGQYSECEDDAPTSYATDAVAVRQSAATQRSPVVRPGYIPLPHTISSFFVWLDLPASIRQPFNVLVQGLRSLALEDPDSRIECVHDLILGSELHRTWHSVSHMQEYFDDLVHDRNSSLFSSGRADSTPFSRTSDGFRIEELLRNVPIPQTGTPAPNENSSLPSTGRLFVALRDEDPAITNYPGGLSTQDEGNTPRAVSLNTLAPNPRSYWRRDEAVRPPMSGEELDRQFGSGLRANRDPHPPRLRAIRMLYDRSRRSLDLEHDPAENSSQSWRMEGSITSTLQEEREPDDEDNTLTTTSRPLTLPNSPHMQIHLPPPGPEPQGRPNENSISDQIRQRLRDIRSANSTAGDGNQSQNPMHVPDPEQSINLERIVATIEHGIGTINGLVEQTHDGNSDLSTLLQSRSRPWEEVSDLPPQSDHIPITAPTWQGSYASFLWDQRVLPHHSLSGEPSDIAAMSVLTSVEDSGASSDSFSTSSESSGTPPFGGGHGGRGGRGGGLGRRGGYSASGTSGSGGVHGGREESDIEMINDLGPVTHPNLRAAVALRPPPPVPHAPTRIPRRRAPQHYRAQGLPVPTEGMLPAPSRYRPRLPTVAVGVQEHQPTTLTTLLRPNATTNNSSIRNYTTYRDRSEEYPDSDEELFLCLSDSNDDGSSTSDGESVCSRDGGRPAPRLDRDKIGYSNWYGRSLHLSSHEYSLQTFGTGGYANYEDDRDRVGRRGYRPRIRR